MVYQPVRWLLFVLLVAASTGSLLFAQETGEVVIKRGIIENDLYVAGRSVNVVAQVQGDVVAAGNRVNVLQSVSGDVLVAGDTVMVNARVDDDVRAAGRFVSIGGSIAGHVVAAGETVTIAPAAIIGEWAWLAGREVNIAGWVGKGLKVAAQSVTIFGEINGDVELMADEIRIFPSARINGDLIYRSDNEPHIADRVEITGDIIAKPVPYKDPAAKGAAFIFIAALAVAAIVYYLLFPVFSMAAASGLQQSPFIALGLGLAFLFATPFVLMLLLVTVIGALLALPLLAWYLVSLLGGLLTGIIYLGDIGLRLVGKAGSAGKAMRILSIVLALVVLLLIQISPVAGGIAVLVLLVLGIGVFQRQAWRAYSHSDQGETEFYN